MSFIKSRKHASAPAALGLLIAALPLHAQQAAPTPAASASSAHTLPAVKATGRAENDYKADAVSSPKFTQPLVDTPQTITVIKKEILQQQQATTLTEALRNTPGITMLMGENGNTATGDSIFMRGFDTSGSIFVDGIRDLGTVTRDTFNVESIEVVKGPAGTDNGRGSPTGYVNLVTKLPTLEEFGTGSVAAGTGSRKRATVDLNKPLDIGIPGSAVRLNVMGQDFGGIDRDVVQYKSWGIAPSLALGLGTPTRTFIYALHTRQDNIPDGGIPTIGMPGFYNAIFDPTARPGDANDPGNTATPPTVTANR
ncbi:MAG: TonB-dependent receptor for iron transport, partial [Rhizobacter sp.]|nr:TonB-dependent receptor for iron transport [Rhizobacter sp.]